MLIKKVEKATSGKIENREAFEQAWMHIILSSCFSIALKYAGSGDPDAYAVILRAYKELEEMLENSMVKSNNFKSLDAHLKTVGKEIVYQHMCQLMLYLSIIKSGECDMELIRMCRAKLGQLIPFTITDSKVLYGCHMVKSIALGISCLGCGHYTFSTSVLNEYDAKFRADETYPLIIC
jgi:hypothetical protein